MTTTLLITTYNWPQALRLVLESAFIQSVLPNEIVIADDGSGEETRTLIEEMTAKSPVPLKHVWHEDRGFRLAMIRNKGVAASEGEYILQIDGDCILSPHYVEDHIAMSKLGYFAGGKRIVLTEEMTRSTLEEGRLSYSVIGLLRKKKGLREVKSLLRLPHLMKWYSERISRTRAHEMPIAGFSFSFWKKDFVAVNGYDETMEGWGFEDIDIAYRLGMLGIRHTPIRFGGYVFHLWHKTRDLGIPDAENPNFLKMQTHLTSGTYFAETGYDRHLDRSDS